jgi:hypothetical protein
MLRTKTNPDHGFSATIRIVIAATFILTVARVWLGPGTALPRAQAQVPDPARQRHLLLDETRETNRLLSDIKALLESGTLNVRLRGADNPSDEDGRAPVRP